jgi:hypothetical protein
LQRLVKHLNCRIELFVIEQFGALKKM